MGILNPHTPIAPREPEELAEMAPDDAARHYDGREPAEPAHRSGERSRPVADVLKQNGMAGSEKPSKGARVYQLAKCLTPGVSQTDGAAIVEAPNGKLAYVCLHNRCWVCRVLNQARTAGTAPAP